ncbi:MAG: 4Fe-4S binding protein [Flavobacteriales bacterium]|nr:4Fe-4S binding protein [Flavobacteriales bacterium]
MSKTDHSLSIADQHSGVLDGVQKGALTLASLGVLGLIVSLPFSTIPQPAIWLALSLSAIVAGTLWYAHHSYANKPAGIKNNGVWHSGLTTRGIAAWVVGILLTGLYILLYFYPEYLGQAAEGEQNKGLIALFDPLAQLLHGGPASQWFMYGTLYTVSILAMGYKFILKYRNNKYQIVRTISVMFFQLGFAFLLPELLARLSLPYNDFKNMWPLNYSFFDEWNVKGLIDAGGFGLFMLLFGVAMIFVISPILTYFYGKRWYCSWVCGCGGLAETAGDPFRQLSDKSTKAWKMERWIIHTVLVFAVVMTVALVYSYLGDSAKGFWVTRGMLLGIIGLALGSVATVVLVRPGMVKEVNNTIRFLALGLLVAIIGLTVHAYITGRGDVFFVESYPLRKWYGFFIGAIFSGVIGVGFYPLMGSRVWCRFGCPMAAILGMQQRFFSRFRITTNGGQCISCGNCSTYCEMGIDVRSYAQRGENIVRSSCVGCGICAAVCPRGVLKLESRSSAGGKVQDRVSSDPIAIGKTGATLR